MRRRGKKKKKTAEGGSNWKPCLILGRGSRRSSQRGSVRVTLHNKCLLWYISQGRRTAVDERLPKGLVRSGNSAIRLPLTLPLTETARLPTLSALSRALGQLPLAPISHVRDRLAWSGFGRHSQITKISPASQITIFSSGLPKGTPHPRYDDSLAFNSRADYALRPAVFIIFQFVSTATPDHTSS